MPSQSRQKSHSLHLWLPRIFTLFLASSSISQSSAYSLEPDSAVYDTSLFQSLANLGQIHLDTRPPPPLPSQTTYSPISATSIPTPTTTPAPLSPRDATSIPTDSTSTSLSLVTSATITIIASPLPSPFDTSLGSNFTTTSCPTFFTHFLTNSTFNSCLPISLLLQNSASFFRAERSAQLLTETLDSSCAASLAICSPLMSVLASELISSPNCGADYQLQNPVVVQAYNGLVAYEPLYRATCLRDQDTGEYCFTEAIVGVSDTATNGSTTNGTNTTDTGGGTGSTNLNPADSYPYYTALGLNMINGSRPDCSACLQQTMAIFSEYASENGQPLAGTYVPCATEVNVGCGAGWASVDVKTGAVSAAETSGAGRFMGEGRESRWVIWIGMGVLVLGVLM